jgi:hypothetical protein
MVLKALVRIMPQAFSKYSAIKTTTRIRGGLPKAYKALIIATPKSAPEKLHFLSLII